MTPEQKIKHLILARDAEMQEAFGAVKTGPLPDISAENVDDIFDSRNEDWGLEDALQEVRSGEVETQIDCGWSRHYECKAVASRYFDGSWVGWTYWYGGGKHGEPEAIEWIPDAYDLDVTEEEKVVTVRTFAKVAK